MCANLGGFAQNKSDEATPATPSLVLVERIDTALLVPVPAEPLKSLWFTSQAQAKILLHIWHLGTPCKVVTTCHPALTLCNFCCQPSVAASPQVLPGFAEIPCFRTVPSLHFLLRQVAFRRNDFRRPARHLRASFRYSRKSPQSRAHTK